MRYRLKVFAQVCHEDYILFALDESLSLLWTRSRRGIMRYRLKVFAQVCREDHALFVEERVNRGGVERLAQRAEWT